MPFVIRNLETIAKKLQYRIQETKERINNKEYLDELQKQRMNALIKRLQLDYEETLLAIDKLQG